MNGSCVSKQERTSIWSRPRQWDRWPQGDSHPSGRRAGRRKGCDFIVARVCQLCHGI